MSDADTRNAYFDQLFANGDLAWLGQNTNHVPAHSDVIAALHRSVDAAEFNAYAPPLGFESLRAAIVRDMGVPGVNAVVTEGGVSGLAMICRAYCRAGTTFVTTDPTWKWPGLFARQAGAEVIEIPIYDPDVDYKLTPDALRSAVDARCAIIYIVDPNNPLGIRYDRADIEAFSEIARSVGAVLVHDCTYRDFAQGHTPAIAVAPDVGIVTTSFSKWLGLAGLRVGAVVASPDRLEACAATSTSVLGASVLAQRAAEAGLKVKPQWMAEVKALDSANKAMIREAALALGMSVPVYPSHGNFLVIEIEGADVTPEALVEAARRHDIMIRQGRYHTERFGHRFIKVSTSVPAQWASRFASSLPALVQEARTINHVPALF